VQSLRHFTHLFMLSWLDLFRSDTLVDAFAEDKGNTLKMRSLKTQSQVMGAVMEPVRIRHTLNEGIDSDDDADHAPSSSSSSSS
tara:strand:+ start:169 stop:420 length:252 start_codon:yes stop_codon:yes gene_type:complete